MTIKVGVTLDSVVELFADEARLKLVVVILGLGLIRLLDGRSVPFFGWALLGTDVGVIVTAWVVDTGTLERLIMGFFDIGTSFGWTVFAGMIGATTLDIPVGLFLILFGGTLIVTGGTNLVSEVDVLEDVVFGRIAFVLVTACGVLFTSEVTADKGPRLVDLLLVLTGAT